MKPSEAFRRHREQIQDIIAVFPVANPRIYGSVLRGEDIEGSDLDILVDATPETTMLSLVRLEVALGRLLGVEVDVVTPDELNGDYRNEVLGEAVPL
jgi:uncharacterized protein